MAKGERSNVMDFAIAGDESVMRWTPPPLPWTGVREECRCGGAIEIRERVWGGDYTYLSAWRRRHRKCLNG